MFSCHPQRANLDIILTMFINLGAHLEIKCMRNGSLTQVGHLALLVRAKNLTQ